LKPPAAGQRRQEEAIYSVINQWSEGINKACWVKENHVCCPQVIFFIACGKPREGVTCVLSKFLNDNDINILFKLGLEEYIFKRFT
jgi:hypothetical protein